MKKVPVNVPLGRRVQSRMTKLKMANSALAAAVGMSQQGINDIANGRVLRPKILREIAEALRTTEEWLLHERGHEEVPEKTVDKRVLRVQVIEWVQAGNPSEAAFSSQDDGDVLLADLGRGDFFATRVVGDSMDRVSPEGSIIVVNRADREVVTGRHYIFSIKGETTYKTWHAGNPPMLKPFSTNLSHDPIFFRKKDFEVVGRVVRSIIDL